MALSPRASGAPLCPYCHAVIPEEGGLDRHLLTPPSGGMHFRPLTALACRSCGALLGFQ